MNSFIQPLLRYRALKLSLGGGSKLTGLASQCGAWIDPSFDNSQRGSKDLATLLLAKRLDGIIDALNYDAPTLRESVRPVEQAIQDMTARFRNSALENDSVHLWENCPQDDADLIYIGALCSEAVYEPQRRPTAEGFEFSRDTSLEIKSSWNGNMKATAFWGVSRVGSDGNRIAVISVRGTKGFLDNLVCINSEPSEATDFIIPRSQHEKIYAHKGFLNCARLLAEDVRRYIEALPNTTRVLFTGHSAGGAVSSLLFCHVLTESRKIDSSLANKSLTLSCITFGAPPILDPDLTSMDLSTFPIGRVHRVLTFIREGDPVPRADKNYVTALLDLYRLTIEAGSILTDEPPAVQDRPNFDFEPSRFRNFGHLVVVKDNNDELENPDSDEDLFAYDVPNREFEKLIYGTIAYHHKAIYVDMAEKIQKRQYNGYNRRRINM